MVTLKRPDVMNALNTPVRAEITHAVGKSGKTAREACTVAMPLGGSHRRDFFLTIGISGGTFGHWPNPNLPTC